MKKLIKHQQDHKITSIMGIILFAFAFIAFWFNKMDWFGFIGAVLVSGFLLYAKDEILEKITFGLLKINKDESNN